MKLRSIISALVVFTIVMTCAVSAVSAATFTTTTNYSPSGVTVTTNVTGVTGSPMISYVIYDDEDGSAPSEGNIKYIDQMTVSGATTSFTVTDTVAKLDGNKILLGSSGEAVTPEVSGDDRVANIDGYSALLVTYDGLVDKTSNSVTFLIHQNRSDVKTGINVVATVGDEEYVFNGLMNLSDNTYYAIQLVDERENGIDFSGCTFAVTPVVDDGTEMTNVSGSNYWIETAAGN